MKGNNMKVKEKINMDIEGLVENGPINIVAFGDSVTHGAHAGWFDYETVYWNRLKKKLNSFRDSIPVNVINAGVGGYSAKTSLPRLHRDVISHNPDLVIVCFGLNDVYSTLDEFSDSLRTIFTELTQRGIDTIYMTPNMFNTYVSDDTAVKLHDIARKTAEIQNGGRMDTFIERAISIAKECGVTVCDCYAEWKRLNREGVDTTALLINRINHPNVQMHELFADMLYKCIMGDSIANSEAANAMYKG
jgi:lysophospholipase L1-like esterase